MIKITLILSIAALISASNQSKEITLKWDDHSDNEDGFCLEYLNDQMGMWTAIDSIGMNILNNVAARMGCFALRLLYR